YASWCPCYNPYVATAIFHLILSPPKSPLFPYTTLFRSKKSGSTPLLNVSHRAPQTQHVRLPFCSYQYSVMRRKPALNSGPPACIDRKSTRLNSSHVKISYAVFCLNKKNKQNNQH